MELLQFRLSIHHLKMVPFPSYYILPHFLEY
uniref:Sucrose nonfermenting 4-like protein n=1 Tax=Rhizophora mucronata TaxID=61149 RepID=A0A2P2L3B4_RHIMU